MNKKHIFFILLLIAIIPSLLVSFYFYKNYVVFTNDENTENVIINEGGIYQNQVINETDFVETEKEVIIQKKTPTMEFASIPLSINSENDFLLFYESLKIEFDEKIDNIVLILKGEETSSYDFTSIPSEVEGAICFQADCLNVKSLIDNKIKENKNFIKRKSDYFSLITDKIGIHFKFLEKAFKEKNIGIIFLNPNNFENINELKVHLLDKFKDEATLFLSINDFSEIEDIKYQKFHNIKTFYTLNNSKTPLDYKEIEVSCPTCLYLNNSLAIENNKYPHKFFDKENFIYYYDLKKEDNGIVIMNFGDLMFDRNVSLYLTSKEKFNNFFKDFFENSDTTLDLNTHKTRKLFGFDFVAANLETPVVTEFSECEASSKSIKFCSKNIFLPWVKDMGFNIFSLANNHSMDGGVTAHKSTINNLENEGLNYFGYVRHGSLFEKDYVHTSNIRGIDYAWHSYDFTIYGNSLTEKYCTSLKDYKNKGYNNIVAVHWGNEYQYLEHSVTQENYAKKLIDCGADLIIGHHPHVIQDIGWYKEKPIIYSLGNFLFDQDWSENTQLGMGVLIDYNINGTFRIETDKRNVAVKKSDSY